MSRDKQIEEIEKVLKKSFDDAYYGGYEPSEDITAEDLYTAGYRKASDLEIEIADLKSIAEQYQKQFEEARTDVAREIFAEIEKALYDSVETEHFKGTWFNFSKFKQKLAELEKKYESEERM